MKHKQEWVLVTGGAKRIGRAIALAFAQEGYSILLHYHRSSLEAQQTVEQIRTLGCQAASFQLDLTDIKAVRHWIEKNPPLLQKIKTIIHSASLFYPSDSKQSIEARNAFHTIHCESPLLISRSFAECISAISSRSIINITDAMIEKPYPGYADYFISKAALQEQTRTLSVEYAPHLRVNAVAPGCILFPDDYDDSKKSALLRGVPLRREGTPEDIANACVFLAQQEYITGQTLKVDGGRSL